jgi:hypothetical protein
MHCIAQCGTVLRNFATFVSPSIDTLKRHYEAHNYTNFFYCYLFLLYVYILHKYLRLRNSMPIRFFYYRLPIYLSIYLSGGKIQKRTFTNDLRIIQNGV